MRKLKILILSVFFIFLSSIYFFKPLEKPLEVLGDFSYAPFEFLNEKGESEGILIDIWKLWSKKTGLEADYFLMPWKDSLSAVIVGEGDILGGIFSSPEREVDYDFSVPFFEITTSIFFHKDISGIVDVEDLAGFKIAVVEGDYSAEFLKNHPKGFDVVGYGSYSELIDNALIGKVKVFVMDTKVALYHLSKSEKGFDFRYSEKPLYSSFFRAGVKEGNSELLEKINNGFALITKDEINAISAKWTGTLVRGAIDWKLPALFIVVILAGLFGVLLWNAALQKGIVKATKELNERKSEIKINRKKYKDLFDTNPDGIVIYNLSGEMIEANSSFYEMVNYSYKELIELKEKIVPAKYSDYEKRIFEKVKSSDNPWRYEKQYLKKDGSVISVDITCWLEKDSEGVPKRINTHVSDISENKNAMRELEMTNRKLEKQYDDLVSREKELKLANEELTAKQEELESSYERLESISKGFETVISLTSFLSQAARENDERFYQEVMKGILLLIPQAEAGSISLIKNGKWIFVSAVGHDFEKLKKMDFDASYLKLFDKPVVINDIMKKNKERMKKEDYERLCSAVVPTKTSLMGSMKLGEKLLGHLSVDIGHSSSYNFSDEDTIIMESFANMASSFFAMENYIIEQGRFQKDLIMSMIKILEMYEPYTKGHSENVAKYSAKMAEKMNMKKETIVRVYWAGLVHDIGKILVPVPILIKVEKLTPDEFSKIKMHPLLGAEVLKTSDELSDIMKYVKYHHERWDGKGYPEGLKEEEIPLISRIISVADSFDAMSNDRPYRKAMPLEKCLEELISGKGTQFDAKLVDLFINEKIYLEKK